MKKALFVVIFAILAFSCKMYDNTVKSRYLTRDPVRYDTTHYDAQNKPIPVYDSIYVVGPTWAQAYHKMSPFSKRVFWGGSGMMVASLAIYTPTAFTPMIGTAMAGGALAASSWEYYRWNYDHEISKQQYDSLMKADGDLHAFWNSKR